MCRLEYIRARLWDPATYFDRCCAPTRRTSVRGVRECRYRQSLHAPAPFRQARSTVVGGIQDYKHGGWPT